MGFQSRHIIEDDENMLDLHDFVYRNLNGPNHRVHNKHKQIEVRNDIDDLMSEFNNT